jgi:hypothetical protein
LVSVSISLTLKFYCCLILFGLFVWTRRTIRKRKRPNTNDDIAETSKGKNCSTAEEDRTLMSYCLAHKYKVIDILTVLDASVLPNRSMKAIMARIGNLKSACSFLITNKLCSFCINCFMFYI